MRLLLDSHILMWWTDDSPRLAPHLRALINDPANEIWLSVATIWELCIKAAAGRLSFPSNEIDEMLRRTGFRVLDITLDHATAAASLPRHHDDPFDRMLIAQAGLERLTLISVDEKIARYAVDLLR